MIGRKSCLLLHDLNYENAVRESTLSSGSVIYLFSFESGSSVHCKAKDGLELLFFMPLSSECWNCRQVYYTEWQHLSEIVTIDDVRCMKSMSGSRSGTCLVPVEDGSSPGQWASRLVIVRIAYVGMDRIV